MRDNFTFDKSKYTAACKGPEALGSPDPLQRHNMSEHVPRCLKGGTLNKHVQYLKFPVSIFLLVRTFVCGSVIDTSPIQIIGQKTLQFHVSSIVERLMTCMLKFQLDAGVSACLLFKIERTSPFDFQEY